MRSTDRGGRATWGRGSATRYGLRARLFNAIVFLGLVAGLTLAAVGPWAATPVPRLVVLGDSLTAGYGLPLTAAFPARLEQALRSRGVQARVLNAGVSGDTTAGGLARLGWVLADKPDFVIVELGANDGLRGIDPAAVYRNLDAILARLRAKGIGVLLAGMYAPPNFGREYGAQFNAVYPRLAAKHDVVFYPFFLDGVAAQPSLNLGDGIHPNAAGVDVIVERILPYVLRLLEQRRG